MPVVADLRRRKGPCFLVFEDLAEHPGGRPAPTPKRPGCRTRAQFVGISAPGPGRLRRHRDLYRIQFWLGQSARGGRTHRRIVEGLGLDDLRIGIVEGDNLLGVMAENELCALPALEGLTPPPAEIIAANVYLGGAPIAEALDRGADLVVTGRCADPALVVGPAMHAFGWGIGDLDRAGGGHLRRHHLVECGAQVTGGYFADPGRKDVGGLDQVGFPIAELSDDDGLVITKAAGTGGAVDLRTVKEQLLYEIHDPSAYLTPT